MAEHVYTSFTTFTIQVPDVILPAVDLARYEFDKVVDQPTPCQPEMMLASLILAGLRYTGYEACSVCGNWHDTLQMFCVDGEDKFVCRDCHWVCGRV